MVLEIKPIVLELGQIVAGPTAGLILADLGFNVIKIEQPGRGDIARYFTGPSEGNFAFFNRGKRSMTLNLKTEEGREIFLKLVERSDIIIENMGYGTMERLGVGYSVLSKINPRIIYLSIKGYGSGPYEDRNALDYPIEVESGVAYMNGLSNKPMRLGASIIDIAAAMFGVIGVLHALLERERTGKGTFIKVGLFETAMFLMGQHIAAYQARGFVPLKPMNEEGFAWAIYDFFETADGKRIFIAITTDAQWHKFCELFKLPICESPEYSTNEARYQRRSELIPMIAETIRRLRSDELIRMLRQNGISYAVLNTPWDLLNDPHASKKLISINYNQKQIKVPVTPLESDTIRYNDADPPELGDSTEIILKELGYSKEDIDRLIIKGVI
ncbi:CaiB/BaiF CoA transferase family protein [Vulcanisaeta thermophila]|uniref:CaiB/BaiF CoA transferase family protein n=1 Tax=Vulcanisaeta thermophila TaxID=867917 RepID=UPI00085370EC|nr:CaiB/BaiF CoA-transferase family protein [Vulcanisaeta thermophila]